MANWELIATNLLAAGGGGAAVSFAIFKGLGNRWLDNRFAQQIEKAKQDHATEIEHLRFRIAGMLDRTTKLNQREFETLPKIWEKADSVYATTSYLLSRWRTTPDFTRMSEAHFTDFIDSVALPSFQKTEIIDAAQSDRNRLYGEFTRWAELTNAKKASQKFSDALSKGSIYLHPATFTKLKEFEKRAVDAVIDRQTSMQYPRERGDPPINEPDADAFRENGQSWFADLGTFLRDRYWESNS